MILSEYLLPCTIRGRCPRVGRLPGYSNVKERPEGDDDCGSCVPTKSRRRRSAGRLEPNRRRSRRSRCFVWPIVLLPFLCPGAISILFLVRSCGRIHNTLTPDFGAAPSFPDLYALVGSVIQISSPSSHFVVAPSARGLYISRAPSAPSLLI
jgi:hypothetical protein